MFGHITFHEQNIPIYHLDVGKKIQIHTFCGHINKKQTNKQTGNKLVSSKVTNTVHGDTVNKNNNNKKHISDRTKYFL